MLINVNGVAYVRRRPDATAEPQWRGLWVLERRSEPRDLVGTFRTARECQAAAEEDAAEVLS